MQALMLAAGMGKRLGKFTKGNTKCMLEIQGKTLVERATEALLEAGINEFIIVSGYKGDSLKKFITEECKNPCMKKMHFHFIENDIYDKTNNIYSLYLAREAFTKDDTILLESDLIYDYEVIKKLVNDKNPNVVSVAKYRQWMDGTVVKLDDEKNVTEFIEKKDFDYNMVDKYYKTVNIYKFSKEFINQNFIPFLESYIKVYGKNEYYELILKIIAHLSRSNLKGLDISGLDWYEIDDAQDLDITKCIFSSGKERLENFQKHYGGYWRFDGLKDYCYLVNPYFPTKEMLDKIDYFSKSLITNYPSGQAIECINASRLLNYVDEKYLCVGNGAAELINALGKLISGKMYVSKSVFNEYVRCFVNCEFNIYDLAKSDYQFNVDEIIKNIPENDTVCIVSPDNPTGAFIEKDDVLKILDEGKKHGTRIIFDESFIDFADPEKKFTLFDNDIIEKYDNLVVVKSISKSYGIPGMRLGIIGTSDVDLLKEIKDFLPVWNINSYGEYFLQIANLYKSDYQKSCELIANERKRFIKELRDLGIKVYDSQANYVMCDLGENDSTEVSISLLNQNVFIKDLKTKQAFTGMNFIRLAIKGPEENDFIINVLKETMR